MSRTAMPTGSHGIIRYERSRSGSGYRARAQVRDWDGVTRPIERSGRSKGLAKDRLLQALAERNRIGADDELTSATKVRVLAEVWHKYEIDQARLAGTTLDQYRRLIDRFAIPMLGETYIRELTVGRLDRHQAEIREKHGVPVARLYRTVLSGMCALARRREALASNPMRDVGKMYTPEPAPKGSFTIAQAKQLRIDIGNNSRAVSRDLPDLVSMMLATGGRISEVMALRFQHVDWEKGEIGLFGNIRREKGKELYINEVPTSKLKHRTLKLPQWAMELLVRRREEIKGDVIFPALRAGTLRDPSNTAADLKDAFRDIGLDDATSHQFRRTVATLMDDSGQPIRYTADQLGHSKQSMTQDKYLSRKVSDTGAAAVLEALDIS
jgi:integrase